MPTVPLVRERTVDTQPVSGPRVSSSAPLSAFGGGDALESTNQATQGFTNNMMKLALEQKQKADQVVVLDGDNQMANAENFILRDPEKGALNKRGKDAFGVPDMVNEQWNKSVDEIEGKMSNAEQKAAFRRMAIARKADIDKLVQSHVSNEFQKYDTESTNSFIDNEANAATLNYTDPQRINLAIMRQQGAILDFAKRNGQSSEWVQNKTAETISKTQASVINRMLANGQDIIAKDYYEKNKGMIDGDTAVLIEKNLEEGTLRGESQRASDKIISEYNDLAAAREAVRDIKDPKLRDAVDERVQKEFQFREKQLKMNREQMFLDAANTVESTKSIDSVTPDKWNLLLPNQREALRALEKQINFPEK